MDEVIEIIDEFVPDTNIYLALDDNGYLCGTFLNPLGKKHTPDLPHLDSIDGIDLSGNRIFAYYWDGEKLILDEDRLAELLQEEAAEQNRWSINELTEQLRQSDSVVLEALEGLFSATTATGFITSLIAASRSIRTTLAERANLRQRIQELKGGNS